MTTTVKLIIEIPKVAYGACKALKTDNDQEILTFCVVNAVANGTPLDDVKAEIEQFREDLTEKAPSLKDVINAQLTVDICLGIIDKHIEGVK